MIDIQGRGLAARNDLEPNPDKDLGLYITRIWDPRIRIRIKKFYIKQEP